jgi:hypothetical protein
LGRRSRRGARLRLAGVVATVLAAACSAPLPAPIPAAPVRPQPPPAVAATTVTIHYDGHALHPHVRTIVVLPGAVVPLVAGAAPTTGGERFAVQVHGDPGDLHWETERGTIVAGAAGDGRRLAIYRAPATPGVDHLRVRRGPSPSLGAAILVLVMIPIDDTTGPTLAGYRLGRYPPPPPADTPHARARRTGVRGLVELAAEHENLPVSARVRLGALDCKQQPGRYPRYLALDPRLLDKLETLMDRLAAAGWPPEALVIMSAYRTPYYHHSIGNRTVWSRHLLGDAADVYLDRDGDGQMDDLDGDGQVTDADALVLLAIVEDLDADPEQIGGAAAYPATAAHGPFVHLDTRGYRARWSGLSSE